MTTTSFSSYDRSVPIISDDSKLSSSSHRFSTKDTESGSSHLRQHSDDMDLSTIKRQHVTTGFREDNNLSNSVDDLTQLNNHMLYRNSTADQDFNDPDDDELHFDDGSNFDYGHAIQERLKRANEVFEHDNTPAELTHRQRVSFDSVVKAVDIVEEPEDENTKNSTAKQPISPVVEELTTNDVSSQSESNPHEYTVPLNDTQPKGTPTLVEQIKAMQFYNSSSVGDRRFTSNANTTNRSSTREDNSSPSKLNENDDANTSKNSNVTTQSSSKLSQSSVLVAKNGKFEFQDEDDYTAKRSINDSESDSDNDDNHKSTTKTTRITHTPTPPTDAKSDPLHRSHPLLTRPKSSDNRKRPDNKFNDPMSKSLPSNRNKSSTNNQQRAKSATVSKSIESFIIKPSSVDFDELNRKAAERKRAELQEERRKREQADAKRKEELAKAKESYEKWLHDKDAERRRLNEEKRMEREEDETRQAKCEQELEELREKKYKEWIERKNREITMANEFKKLQAKEEDMTSGGSSSSIHNSQQQNDHRAFHRWLRQKYEQSKEEKRRLRLETRRLRRHQRRSLKRYQLQQDLQLARSFGYT